MGIFLLMKPEVQDRTWWEKRPEEASRAESGRAWQAGSEMGFALMSLGSH